jgi:hypothetical protein
VCRSLWVTPCNWGLSQQGIDAHVHGTQVPALLAGWQQGQVRSFTSSDKADQNNQTSVPSKGPALSMYPMLFFLTLCCIAPCYGPAVPRLPTPLSVSKDTDSVAQHRLQEPEGFVKTAHAGLHCSVLLRHCAPHVLSTVCGSCVRVPGWELSKNCRAGFIPGFGKTWLTHPTDSKTL